MSDITTNYILYESVKFESKNNDENEQLSIYFNRHLSELEVKIYDNMKSDDVKNADADADTATKNNLIIHTYEFVNQINSNRAVKYMDTADITNFLNETSIDFNIYFKLMESADNDDDKKKYSEHLEYYINHFKDYPEEFEFKFGFIDCQFEEF